MNWQQFQLLTASLVCVCVVLEKTYTFFCDDTRLDFTMTLKQNINNLQQKRTNKPYWAECGDGMSLDVMI